MQLQHYITFNIGRGPMTVLTMEDENGVSMLRISPNAKSNRVTVASEADMKAAIDRENLRDVFHNITQEIADSINEAVLQWIGKNRHDIGAIRWESNKCKTFRTNAEANMWDTMQKEAEISLPSAGNRRKRFMLG